MVTALLASCPCIFFTPVLRPFLSPPNRRAEAVIEKAELAGVGRFSPGDGLAMWRRRCTGSLYHPG
jgi:hypothetical protein